jgi:hypothetical protein
MDLEFDGLGAMYPCMLDLEHPTQNQLVMGGEAPRSYMLRCKALNVQYETLILNTSPHVRQDQPNTWTDYIG